MKKLLCTVLCVLLLVGLMGCQKPSQPPEESRVSAEDIATTTATQSEEKPAGDGEGTSAPVEGTSAPTEGPIDSTQGSATTKSPAYPTDPTAICPTAPPPPSASTTGTATATTTDKGEQTTAVTTTTTTTSTAAKETTSTTKAPAAPSGVVLPEVGYAFDEKGRIFLKEASVSGNAATFIIENRSGTWLTSEESTVAYTVYDKNGKVLASGDLYVGMVRCKKTTTATLTLPAGVARVEFGKFSTTYWSDWK